MASQLTKLYPSSHFTPAVGVSKAGDEDAEDLSAVELRVMEGIAYSDSYSHPN